MYSLSLGQPIWDSLSWGLFHCFILVYYMYHVGYGHQPTLWCPSIFQFSAKHYVGFLVSTNVVLCIIDVSVSFKPTWWWITWCRFDVMFNVALVNVGSRSD